MKQKQYDVRLSFMATEEMNNQIIKLAALKGIKKPEMIRELVEQSLEVNALNKNIDLITEIIRNEILTVLKPSVERLAALEAKTCMASATAMYLSAEALEKFVAPVERVQMQEAYNKARKKAINYTRGKEE